MTDKVTDRVTEPLVVDIGGVTVLHFASVASTMDEAHRLAQIGVRSGTCILADEQSAGRGRSGKKWVSHAKAGIWLTLVERGPASGAGLAEIVAANSYEPEQQLALAVEGAVQSGVMALRTGLCVAELLAELDDGGQYSLKWPNDVYRNGEKVAGILVEARWREERLDWVAVGIGINLMIPESLPVELSRVAAVSSGSTEQWELLARLIPVLRRAAATSAHLSEDELKRWRSRDWTLGRVVVKPAHGVSRGISRDGSLLLETASGLQAVRSGSLELADI